MKVIELVTYSSSSLNPFFEFDAEALDNTASLFPEISLPQIVEKSSIIIREFSPVLIGEKPYLPTDNFIVKCLKYAVASTKALLFKTDEIRAALKAYHTSNKVIETLSQRVNQLEERILDHFNDMQSLQFELEMGRCLLSPEEGLIEELIPKFVEAYQVVLDARKYNGSGDHKMLLTPDYKDELCFIKELQLEGEAELIRDKASHVNLQERIETLQHHLEQLLHEKTALTEELQVIEDSLREPFNHQLFEH